jgi:hypothetical protein
MRVCPSAVEPPVLPVEDAATDELDPQAASNMPANTINSRELIREIVLLYIIFQSSSRLNSYDFTANKTRSTPGMAWIVCRNYDIISIRYIISD